LLDGVQGLESARGVPASVLARLGITPLPAPAAPIAALPVRAPAPAPAASAVARPAPAPPRAAPGPPEAPPAPAPRPAAPPAERRPAAAIVPAQVWDELVSGEPDRVERAVARLDKRSRATYAARLAKLAISSDPQALAAAEALARLPEPGVATELLRVLFRGDAGAGGSSAAWILRSWAVPLLETPLLKALPKVDAARQANILWVLEAVGGEASVGVLEELGAAKDEGVRLSARAALEAVRGRLGAG
jgi:hypothetical protein